MIIKTFEEIMAWQKGKDLTLHIYKLFKENRDFGFKDQIQRASVSIMNNIAEGFERKGDKEFKHYLYIAKGSCGEVRSMLYVARDLQYVSKEDFIQLYSLSLSTSKLLSGFIKKL